MEQSHTARAYKSALRHAKINKIVSSASIRKFRITVTYERCPVLRTELTVFMEQSMQTADSNYFCRLKEWAVLTTASFMSRAIER